PDLPELAQQVRMFLHRAVGTAAAAGVDQFLDIGAGVPTMGPVHETARQSRPGARVVYVDHDPVAVAHGEAMLAGDGGAVFIQADARSPHAILDNSRVRDLIDFDRPVAVLLCSVLHFVADADDPAGIVATLREAMAPGSFLVVQHATHDGQPRATIDMLEMWNANSPEPMYWRGGEQIERLFEGFTLLDPGVVPLPLWRPEPEESERAKHDPERYASYAAVAVKPGAGG
ncbi:MAG: SAM-dependent methyltransferase, partial [Catenulisporales bacterium]|nr:SAM-dependent methyltransferase [Catenulisporales bacterium]